MAKAQGKFSILPLCCPNAILLYYAFLSSEQENTRGFVLSMLGTAFFTMQSRNAVLPLLLYFFRAICIFHVETLMQVIFCLCTHSLLIFCFKTQVILATNIAESSVTVPDVKYGKLSESCNSVSVILCLLCFPYLC